MTFFRFEMHLADLTIPKQKLARFSVKFHLGEGA